MSPRWRWVRDSRKRLLATHSQRVAQTLVPCSWYFTIDSGNNYIGNKGIEHLSKAKWPSLKKLILSKKWESKMSAVSTQRAVSICRRWNLLFFRIYSSTTTGSEIRGARYYWGESGAICKLFSWVDILRDSWMQYHWEGLWLLEEVEILEHKIVWPE